MNRRLRKIRCSKRTVTEGGVKPKGTRANPVEETGRIGKHIATTSQSEEEIKLRSVYARVQKRRRLPESEVKERQKCEFERRLFGELTSWERANPLKGLQDLKKKIVVEGVERAV